MSNTSSPPLISIVIVTWNSAEFIERCLSPFKTESYIEIVVFDNASSDTTCDIVSNYFPEVKLIRNKINLGFGRGNNAAFNYCSGKYILLLNPDAFLDEQRMGPIKKLAEHLEATPDVAAAGPQLLHEDGRHQVGDAGWKTTLLSVAGHAWGLHKVAAVWPAIYLSNKKLLGREFIEVDWVCGACMLVRSEVVAKIGGFAEDIFMYGEDVEWGERMRKHGYRVHYLPRLTVTHVQGGTQKKQGQVYASTKWMDARAVRFASERSAISFVLFKCIFFTGFLARAWILGFIPNTVQINERKQVMRQFAAHAIRLSRRSS